MSRIYHHLSERVLLPLVDVLSNRTIAQKLAFLQGAQWWSPARVAVYQNTRVRDVIRHSYNNTAYFSKVMNELRIAPDSIRTVEDLAQLPLMNKSLIREHGIEQFLAVPPHRLIRTTTSGSSGEQGTFYFSNDAESLTYAAVLLFFSWAGYRLGDCHVLTGITVKRGPEKRLKDFLFRCYYVSAFNLTDRDLETIVSLLRKRRIKTLIGYASSLHCIASRVLQQGESLELDTVISLGDMLYPHYRTAIETAFQRPVHDTYGCCEGFQIAAQCNKMNFHVCMPLTYLEILDEENNRVPTGHSGRVVLTRLDLNPMPLLRYEVGDRAILSATDSCCCGRSWSILQAIEGRDTDIVVTPNGHRLIVHFFTAIFEHDSRIRQFQVIQNKREEIVIKIIPGERFAPDLLHDIRREILRRCEHDLMVTFEIVDEIPPSKSGKRRFVISKVSANGPSIDTAKTGQRLVAL